MRILLQGRTNILEGWGGIRVLIEGIKSSLASKVSSVEISGELYPDLSNYDLVHCFGITRVHETYCQMINAKKQKKPLVVFPVYENLEEWDRKGRYGLSGVLFKYLKSQDTKEYIKNVYRSFKDPRQREAARLQRKIGYRNQQREVLREADLVIVSSDMEKQALQSLNVKFNSCLIPNAVDSSFAEASPRLFKDKFGLEDFVISVGRIESKKNQLGLIKALKNTKLNIVFVGGFNWSNPGYIFQFRREVARSKNLFHFPVMDLELLKSAYAAAKVHVLPSWFEVFGLVSLEASLAGCNIVTTDRGYTKGNFRDFVWYCNPSDKSSIKKAVLEAYQTPRSDDFKRYISRKYTWEVVGPHLLKIYQTVLEKHDVRKNNKEY